MRSFVLILLLAFFLSPAAHAAGIPNFTGMGMPTPAGGDASVYADFFYSDACPHCMQVKPLVERLAKEHPQVQVRYREIYFNATNREMFWELTDRYGVESGTIPLLIIGTTVLEGGEEIRAGLEPYVTHEPGENIGQYLIQSPGSDSGNTTTATDAASSRGAEITLAAVLTAAAVDSINPCAFAVLVVLLAYLTSIGDRRRLLQVGVAYIATVFVVYLFSGLGFFTVIQASGISGTVFVLAGLIAVAAGMIQIGEALRKHDGFSLSIPESVKTGIGRYVRQASVPSAVVLGGLVSVVELPCTGGIYLAILGLLGSRMTFADGLPYLVLYNLIFVLPLAAILLIVYCGGSPGRVDAWRAGTKRGVRFVIGCVMVALGGAMLLEFL
jgi:cytochrome c biogenesis protein CcdA/thiol-disulfide isomerase/thioredoxin